MNKMQFNQVLKTIVLMKDLEIGEVNYNNEKLALVKLDSLRNISLTLENVVMDIEENKYGDFPYDMFEKIICIKSFRNFDRYTEYAIGYDSDTSPYYLSKPVISDNLHTEIIGNITKKEALENFMTLEKWQEMKKYKEDDYISLELDMDLYTRDIETNRNEYNKAVLKTLSEVLEITEKSAVKLVDRLGIDVDEVIEQFNLDDEFYNSEYYQGLIEEEQETERMLYE